MTNEQSIALKEDLLWVFSSFGVKVAVGLKPGGGVVIRSQDPDVDASNIGVVKPQ